MRLYTFFTIAFANEAYDAVTLFHRIDSNNDRQLTADEVAQWIERTAALDQKLKTDQILKAYDDNGNGRVDRHEMQFHTTQLNGATREQYMGKFEMVDIDESGSLSPREMESLIFPADSEFLAEHAFEEEINNLDRDFNRQISFEEFGSKFNLDLTDESKRIQLYRRHFESFDVDKNGILELTEIDAFLRPSKRQLFTAQAKEILVHFDQNMDNSLDLPEARINPERFVASRLGDRQRMEL